MAVLSRSRASRDPSPSSLCACRAGGVRPELIVVLSDINMPGMDGLGLLQEVKRRNAQLPVIMVTAYGDDERRRRASEYGAADFVTKPVDFDNLKRQLQQLAPPRAEAEA